MALTYPSRLTGLRARVYERLDSSSSAKDRSDRIDSALNEAQREVQSELLNLFQTKHFVRRVPQVTPSNLRIDLPADFIRLVTLEKRLGDEESYSTIDIISPANQHERQGWWDVPPFEGFNVPSHETWSLFPMGPDRYFLKANAANLPTDSVYQYTYQYKIRDLQEDDQETEIPHEYQEMLVYRAVATICQNEGKEERFDMAQKRYMDMMDRMRRTAGREALTKRSRIRRVYNRGL